MHNFHFNHKPWAFAATLTLYLMPALNAHASALLRCQIDQGGTTRTHETAPVQNPYTVPALDINGRFRFKAVVVGDAQRVAYVKVYAYDSARRQPVLLHVSKYLAPTALPQPAPDALTGVQTVYSPRLEREMQYQCALHEVAP